MQARTTVYREENHRQTSKSAYTQRKGRRAGKANHKRVISEVECPVKWIQEKIIIVYLLYDTEIPEKLHIL